MLSFLLLAFIAGKVKSQERPGLVYHQDIYKFLFEENQDTERDELYGVYNENSPPMRKDEMTRYTDGMEMFNNDIDKFVDHHCDPYINFLDSKLFISNFRGI